MVTGADTPCLGDAPRKPVQQYLKVSSYHLLVIHSVASGSGNRDAGRGTQQRVPQDAPLLIETSAEHPPLPANGSGEYCSWKNWRPFIADLRWGRLVMLLRVIALCKMIKSFQVHVVRMHNPLIVSCNEAIPSETCCDADKLNFGFGQTGPLRKNSVSCCRLLKKGRRVAHALPNCRKTLLFSFNYSKILIWRCLHWRP